MANSFQVTIDAAGPRALGAFWCEVLGYVEQPPPPGFDTWEDALDAFGVDRSDPDRAFAIVDREGKGPRVFFQKVPEGNVPQVRGGFSGSLRSLGGSLGPWVPLRSLRRT